MFLVFNHFFITSVIEALLSLVEVFTPSPIHIPTYPVGPLEFSMGYKSDCICFVPLWGRQEYKRFKQSYMGKM